MLEHVALGFAPVVQVGKLINIKLEILGGNVVIGAGD